MTALSVVDNTVLPESDEDALRSETAALTLLLNDHGILGYSGHVSARLPDDETFLIQPVDHPHDRDPFRRFEREGLFPEVRGRFRYGRLGPRLAGGGTPHCAR